MKKSELKAVIRECIEEIALNERPYKSYYGDPVWIKAKYAGTADDGTPFKKGDEILWWPRTKTVMVGKKAEKEYREFQSAAADEFFMSGGRY